MNIALIFAGGVGSRMGSDIPKQFLEWNGKTIIIQTLEVFEKHPEIDEIVVVCKEEWIDFTNNLIQEAKIKKVKSIIPGGDTALDSQYYGLLKVRDLHPQDDVIVLIHDGVRPLVDENTISSCIECTRKYGNAITVTKAIETVICINEEEEITNILDRKNCRMAKAPQAFKLDEILSAHEMSIKDGCHTFIDSASLMMNYGFKLHTIIGKPENIKITTASDYYMYYGIINAENTYGV